MKKLIGSYPVLLLGISLAAGGIAKFLTWIPVSLRGFA